MNEDDALNAYLLALISRVVMLKDDSGVLAEYEKTEGVLTFTWDDRYTPDDVHDAEQTLLRAIRGHGVKVNRIERPDPRMLRLHLDTPEQRGSVARKITEG